MRGYTYDAGNAFYDIPLVTLFGSLEFVGGRTLYRVPVSLPVPLRTTQGTIFVISGVVSATRSQKERIRKGSDKSENYGWSETSEE